MPDLLNGASITGSLNFDADSTYDFGATSIGRVRDLYLGRNLIFGTSSGTQIGTATNQKLAFYGSSPVVQQTGNVFTALTNLGLLGSPTLTESNITNLVSDLALKAPLASPTFTGTVTLNGGVTSPGVGSLSEVYGSGATGLGMQSTVLGYQASAPGNYSTAIGCAATATGNNSVAIGRSATTTSDYGVAIGFSASNTTQGVAIGYSASSGTQALSLGYGAVASGFGAVAFGEGSTAAFNGSFAFGQGATTTAVGQMVFSNSTYTLTDLYLGNVTSTSPSGFAIHGVGGSGSNVAGASLTIAGGIGTGTGGGGSILFQTSAVGTTGSTLNALTTRMTIDNAGGVQIPGVMSLGHLISTGGTPTFTAQVGAGTSPTITVTGTDVFGSVQVVTGSSPTSNAAVVTITFATTFATPPKTVFLMPAGYATAAVSNLIYTQVTSNAQWSLLVGLTALAASTTYKWFYLVAG